MRNQKNQGGRRPIDPALKKSKQVTVNFTEKEYIEVLGYSNKEGVSLSWIIRKDVLASMRNASRKP